ncbi:MAG: AAA family ATPase [Nitrosopumilus sp.]
MIIDIGPQNGLEITIPENSVTVLVGKNGAGKTKILESIKSQKGQNVVLLKGNYENVRNIETINLESTEREQENNQNPINVASIVGANPELLSIFKFYFKSLFDIELTVSNSQFKTGDYAINQEADGFKSLFNLIYYLISPHKFIVLDEPERFFHPSLSTIFINIVSEITKNYEKRIVISTHSPGLMRFDLDNLVIYRISKDPAEITNIREWTNSVKSDDYPQPKHKNTFLDWFYFHSDLVFSSSILLVEGVSDQIILNALKQQISFEYRLESVSIKHVASSYHESGGKSRLHKFQSFLSTLLPTYCLADNDVIGDTINKWYAYDDSKSNSEHIEESKKYNLFILPKGNIEDYYFVNPSYEYCKTVVIAKANKVSASYEQARIISKKTVEELEVQFEDIINYFKLIIETETGIDEILKDLAKEYLIEKHLKGKDSSTHITDAEDNDNYLIGFKFASSTKMYKYPKKDLNQLKELGIAIEEKLNR